MEKYLAIDFGGTNTRLGLVTGENILESVCFSTMPQAGPQKWIERLKINYADLLKKAGLNNASIRGAGIGVPGIIDSQKKIIVSCTNLPLFQNINLVEALEKALDLNVAMENDANCYALGEFNYGVGKNHDSMALLTLGTGVGAGIILNGTPLTGALGFSGEIGHMIVEPNGRLCSCGAKGCLQAYASNLGLKGMLDEALEQGLHTACKQGDGVQLITQAASYGDDLAQKILGKAGKALGLALANLVAILGIDLIVLGGGVSRAWPFMKKQAEKEFARSMRLVDISGIGLLQAELDDNAPLLGGAFMASSIFE